MFPRFFQKITATTYTHSLFCRCNIFSPKILKIETGLLIISIFLFGQSSSNENDKHCEYSSEEYEKALEKHKKFTSPKSN